MSATKYYQRRLISDRGVEFGRFMSDRVSVSLGQILSKDFVPLCTSHYRQSSGTPAKFCLDYTLDTEVGEVAAS
jgi:hypothetical protein